jgi:phage shock protein C
MTAQKSMAQTSPFRRHDTILGVCQAIGDDLGFNPLWLRIVLAAPIVFQSWYGIAAYAALGIAVVVSRLIAPAPKPRLAAPAEVEVVADNVPLNEDAPLALAA